ncbi:MAG TPA: histidinol phosphatase, partial [Verrucomicrobiales bacterium]|nr:histidinol phosphatase [Verrucomicrobiales bacterium]
MELRWVLLAGLLPGAVAGAVPGGDGDPLIPLTPGQRMRREHLETTHREVELIRKTRVPLPEPAGGLHDYRCIFHAHAQDSYHTAGTLPEMLADARKAGVQAVFLGSHYRPPVDFMASWRGLHDGVLFVPGSEVRGFLIHPMESMIPKMEAPVPEFLSAVNAGGGLAFLSHVEERPDHPMEGLAGLEIYNRHYDAKRDMAGLISMAMSLTGPRELLELQDLVRLYPDEILAAQVQRDEIYLDKWDRETAAGRRLTGVAANDCHHNQVFVMRMVSTNEVGVGTSVDKEKDLKRVNASLRPGILELVKGHNPGDLLASVDLDPYYRSFRDSSTHLLADELTEASLRQALRDGRAYVSHDWMCDPTGFSFGTADGSGPSQGGSGAFRAG